MPNYNAPATPLSPKVVAFAVAGFSTPVVLAILGTVLDYLATGPGRTWLDDLLSNTPPLVPVLVFALISALSGAIAGYVKADPLRYHPDAEPGVTAVDDPELAAGGELPVDLGGDLPPGA
jgi:hypothetical protein